MSSKNEMLAVLRAVAADDRDYGRVMSETRKLVRDLVAKLAKEV